MRLSNDRVSTLGQLGLGLLLSATLLGCQGPRPTPAAGAAPLADLGWLHGSWVREDGSTRSEEYWTAPAGGALLGVNRTIVNGRMMFFEYLRIEHQPDGVYYLASPGGQVPATAFKLVEHDTQRLVFENKAHDYPQRIIYRRDGADGLCARIEGQQGGEERASEWCWQRARGPQP